MTCFVVDLLRWVVMLLIISLFVGFCVDKIRFDKVIRSNHLSICFRFEILGILIIKYIDFKLIIFAINMNVVSFFKVFSIFDIVFPSISLITCINKFLYF